MGNSACQSSSVAIAQLALQATAPREFSPRPSMMQPPSALNLRLNEKGEGQTVHHPPRLSFDSKAYQLEMKKRANSKSKGNPLSMSELERELNNCISTSTIKPNDMQRSFDAGAQQQHRPYRQSNSHCKKEGIRVQSVHQSMYQIGNTGSKPAGRLEEFLQKQIEFVQKRNKSIERLRLLKEVEADKENPHRPYINPRSMKIAEKKCHALREKMQEERASKATLLDVKPHLKAVRFADGPSIRSPSKKHVAKSSSPCRAIKLGVMSTGTIVLEFDQCLSRLGLDRKDEVSYLVFLLIMKDLKMVAPDNGSLEDMQPKERYVLGEAWKLVRQSEQDLAKASSVLDFLMVLSKHACSANRLRHDSSEGDLSKESKDDLLSKFQTFIDTRVVAFSAKPQNSLTNANINKPQNRKVSIQPPPTQPANGKARSIDFAPASHKHSRQVSILSQKTIVQIEVNLGSSIQIIRFSKDDDVEDVARRFILQNGLSSEAEEELVRLIRTSLNELN